MALNAAIVWEVRTSGNNNNGGGFKAGASGTDRSQQDAAHLSFTDLEVKGAVYTRVYSVTENANLVATCIGNLIHITGDGGSGLFTVGFYEVTGQGNDGNNYLDIDRNCATGNASDGIAALGGAVADLLEIDSVVVAGNTMYVKAGTYAHASALSVNNGTASLYIKTIGYNTARGDAPTGDNRPLIQDGGNEQKWGTYNEIENFRRTGSHTYGIYTLNYCVIRNCKSTVAANTRCFRYGAGSVVIDCEAIGPGTLGIGFESSGGGSFTIACYAEGLNRGYEHVIGNEVVAFCTFDTCTYGWYGNNVNGRPGCKILNNNFYNSSNTGVYGNYGGQTAYSWLVLNNQFVDCGVGMQITISSPGVYLDFNNFFNNTTDVTNVIKGANTTANNPGYTNAPAGDFSGVDSADGFGIRLGVG